MGDIKGDTRSLDNGSNVGRIMAFWAIFIWV